MDSLRNDVTTQDKLAISVVVYSDQFGFELNVQNRLKIVYLPAKSLTEKRGLGWFVAV